MRDEFWEFVRPLTMVDRACVDFTVEQVSRAVIDKVPGALVECGVWRGGCSLAMIAGQWGFPHAERRPVHMFDSFEGLPQVDARDGDEAKQWQQDNPHNCRASIQQLVIDFQEKNVDPDAYIIHPGWFSYTLNKFNEPIAVLRVDCDWYVPTRDVLSQFGHRLSAGGVIILDDYYAWQGCAAAVHDFLRMWPNLRIETIRNEEEVPVAAYLRVKS